MNYYNIYVSLVFMLKIVVLILLLGHGYLYFISKNDALDIQILFWKERFEFIFKILTAFLLFYIFNPFYDNTSMIDEETKLLFYVLGVILIISANYDSFIKESIFYNYFIKSEYQYTK